MLVANLAELLALRHQAQQLNLSSYKRLRNPLSGLYASVFRGQGMDFDEVREYQSGDEVRHIDWQVTARLGKPYLKLYREERERAVLLCIDNSRYMQFGTRGTFKAVQASHIAALLGWSAHEHGDKVGGMIFGQQQNYFFKPQRRQQAFIQLLKHLTQLPQFGSNAMDLSSALNTLNKVVVTGGLIFVITDAHQTDLTKLKSSLTILKQRHEVILLHIIDQADYNLPNIGLALFTDAMQHNLVVNTAIAGATSKYNRNWHQRQQQLQQLLRSLGIDLINIYTHELAASSLISGLRQRMHRQHQ
jgi:uncharacterized protein (DUF58 family)